MIFTDTWLLYKAARGASNTYNPRSFFEKLAESLIDFRIDQYDPSQGMTSTRTTMDDRKQKSELLLQQVTHVRSSQKKIGTNRAKQLRCSVCRKNVATYVCSHCCVVGLTQIDEVWFCCATTGRSCWKTHLIEKHCNR